MSTHGVTIDETGRHVPQQTDPLARLEEWTKQGSCVRLFRITNAESDCGYDVTLFGGQRTLAAREPSLSAAIHAALAAWEAK